jgi:hypothetical protein
LAVHWRGRAGRAEAEAVIDACFVELRVLVGTAGTTINGII